MHDEDITPIPGWEGLYGVTRDGRVWSYRRRVARGAGALACGGRWLSAYPNASGYLLVSLVRNGKTTPMRVHRAVLLAFVGPCPDGMEARHLNGNRADPHLGNLAWGTCRQNAADRRVHGTEAIGERNGSSKFTAQEVQEVRNRHLRGESMRSIARSHGVSHRTIGYIINRKTWREVADG